MDNTQIKQFIEDGHLTVVLSSVQRVLKQLRLMTNVKPSQQVHSNGRTVTVMVIGRIR